MKITDDLYRHLLYFPNFQQDIFWNKIVILHGRLKELCHVVWLTNGLKTVRINLRGTYNNLQKAITSDQFETYYIHIF